MFLSIITPFKGDIKKLEETLESYKEHISDSKIDYEILLITAEYKKVIPKIKFFKKLKLNIIKEKKNKGIYPAMNKGINFQKEIILFLRYGDVIARIYRFCKIYKEIMYSK